MRLKKSLIQLAVGGLIPCAALGQPITTTYTYDLLGNRIIATDLVRPTGPALTTVEPRIGPVGSVVNIFGTDLPPGDASGLTVTFSGIEAPILSVAPTMLTVEVPEGAAIGPLVVTLPDNSQVDLGQFRMFTICWTGNGDAISWQDPANWDQNRVPDRFDEVGVLSNPNTTVVRFSGNASLIGLTCEEPFEMVSGVLDIRRDLILVDTFVMISGNLTVGRVIKVDGSMTWSGGGIGGSGTTDLSGGLTIDGFVQLVDRVMRIAPKQTTEFAGDRAWLRLSGDATFLNEGIFRVERGGTMDRGGAGSHRFVNTGVFEKLGQGMLNVGLPFENSGDVDLQSGSFRVSAFLYTQSEGATILDGGDLILVNNLMEISGGLVSGTGTITGDVQSTGEFTPGFGVGVITVDGSYDQAGPGSLTVEIGGEGDPCSQLDLLDITGTAVLGGALHIVLIDGCQPELGQQFEVLSYGARVGEFENITGLEIGNGLVFMVLYEPSAVILEVVEP